MHSIEMFEKHKLCIQLRLERVRESIILSFSTHNHEMTCYKKTLNLYSFDALFTYDLGK